jgi:hypothetical protein
MCEVLGREILRMMVSSIRCPVDIVDDGSDTVTACHCEIRLIGVVLRDELGKRSIQAGAREKGEQEGQKKKHALSKTSINILAVTIRAQTQNHLQPKLGLSDESYGVFSSLSQEQRLPVVLTVDTQ